jgi:hypothetical protein
MISFCRIGKPSGGLLPEPVAVHRTSKFAARRLSVKWSRRCLLWASVGGLASRARRIQASAWAFGERASLPGGVRGGRGVCSAGQGHRLRRRRAARVSAAARAVENSRLQRRSQPAGQTSPRQAQRPAGREGHLAGLRFSLAATPTFDPAWPHATPAPRPSPRPAPSCRTTPRRSGVSQGPRHALP